MVKRFCADDNPTMGKFDDALIRVAAASKAASEAADKARQAVAKLDDTVEKVRNLILMREAYEAGREQGFQAGYDEGKR